LQSSVDEFLSTHPELAGKAKNFSRLTDRQKQQIVKQAIKLAAGTNMSRYRIIDKISTKTGKCHETIRYTLLNYEKEHPDKPVFKKTSGVITPAQAAEIYRLYKQGCSIKELMARFERNKSSIYRIINQRRAKALLAKKIEFVASNEFTEHNVKERILAEPIDKSDKSVLDNAEPIKLTGSSLSEYLHTLTDAPVLNRDDEVGLFRRYNYLKYLACQTRDEIKLSKVSGTTLKQIETYLAQADEIKRRIIEANLRLVVNIARKHTLSGANLLDLVSEGNISLMNAVEKFNYSRGFRFATFASWAIAKDYARKIPDQVGRLGKEAKASLANIHRELKTEEAADFAAIERAHHSLAQVIKDNLTEREQYVIINRFGLVGPPVKKETKTLVQIGRELDLSKERIRQIELTALQKLRQSLSPEEFELLTG
jgi:RNA polymerase primary sigma factor